MLGMKCSLLQDQGTGTWQVMFVHIVSGLGIVSLKSGYIHSGAKVYSHGPLYSSG